MTAVVDDSDVADTVWYIYGIQQGIFFFLLDLILYVHIICCRKELFDSLESRGFVHLANRLSYTIKGIGTVSLKTHDGTARNWAWSDTYPIS